MKLRFGTGDCCATSHGTHGPEPTPEPTSKSRAGPGISHSSGLRFPGSSPCILRTADVVPRESTWQQRAALGPLGARDRRRRKRKARRMGSHSLGGTCNGRRHLHPCEMRAPGPGMPQERARVFTKWSGILATLRSAARGMERQRRNTWPCPKP